MLPFFKFLLKRGFSLSFLICLGSKSKADFAVRRSLYILGKFLFDRIMGNSLTGLLTKILSGDCTEERFVSKVFSFCSTLGGLHHSIWRLHQPWNSHQVHDRRDVTPRVPDWPRPHSVCDHHVGWGTRENNSHWRALWVVEKGNWVFFGDPSICWELNSGNWIWVPVPFWVVLFSKPHHVSL